MEAQEIFDTVVTHLRTQGKPARGPLGCSYRTPSGLKCAVGCLITDDEYTPIMDDNDGGTSVAALARDGLLPHRFNSYVAMLEELQGAHDSWLAKFEGIDTKQLSSRLVRIAEKNNLDATLAQLWLDDLNAQGTEPC